MGFAINAVTDFLTLLAEMTMLAQIRTVFMISLMSSLTACAQTSDAPREGTPIRVWATIYSLVEGRERDGGIPIRNMNGRVIGPEVARSDWCAGALAGTMRVAGEVYNFAGTAGSPQANCSHNPSERVRFTRSPHPFGTGAASNPLRPFRSIACDLGNVGGSTPWVDGGYPRFGQQIYIPSAEGTVLPDGTVHDGIFTCEDTGGGVNGNHIDVFLGPVPASLTAMLAANPFEFVSHGDHIEVDAVLLPIRSATE